MTDRPATTFVAPSPTAVVSVTGADRLTYLDAVVSQRITDLEPGTVRGALYLDPQGNPLAAFDVAALDDRLLLLVPDPELADEVVTTLGGRTFLSDASFARSDARVWALRGEGAREVAERAGMAVAPGAVERQGDQLVLVGCDGGLDVIGTDEVARPAVDALGRAGAERADGGSLEAWRIRAGVPRWGHEIVRGRLPEEVGLLPTHVHLGKGCYPGQEAVARMWMLGRPRRRLARLHLTGDVAAGWTAGSGRRGVEVTSASGDAGLGFVPADAEPGDRVEGDGGAVEVAAFVGADREVVGHDPGMVRRRDRR